MAYYIIASSPQYAKEIYELNLPAYSSFQEANERWSKYPLLQRLKYKIYYIDLKKGSRVDHNQCKSNCGQCQCEGQSSNDNDPEISEVHT